MLPAVDLSNPFDDTINHSISFDKLLLIYLVTPFFFNSYLFGRTQTVLAFGFKSSPQMFTKGSQKDQF